MFGSHREAYTREGRKSLAYVGQKHTCEGTRVFVGEEVLGGIANFRWPLKISGRLKSDRTFFGRKYLAECGLSVVTPFGDYNIRGGEDGPEI